LAGGCPPHDEEFVRKGATIAHSSSVIKPRITANLHREMVGIEVRLPEVKGIPGHKKDTIGIVIGRGRFFFAEFRKAV
jgi:hypothetical protein